MLANQSYSSVNTCALRRSRN